MASRGPGREPEQTAQPSASPTGGEGAFTRYLRVLERDGEPPPAAFDELWQALRATVVAELRRSSAWSSPPSYLGVFGWPAWQALETDRSFVVNPAVVTLLQDQRSILQEPINLRLPAGASHVVVFFSLPRPDPGGSELR